MKGYHILPNTWKWQVFYGSHNKSTEQRGNMGTVSINGSGWPINCSCSKRRSLDYQYSHAWSPKFIEALILSICGTHQPAPAPFQDFSKSCKTCVCPAPSSCSRSCRSLGLKTVQGHSISHEQLALIAAATVFLEQEAKGNLPNETHTVKENTWKAF